MHPVLLSIALLPLLFRLVPLIIPSHYLESYNYWSSDDFNRVEGQDLTKITQWRNQGYWRDTNIYPEAAEALARKLLDLADYTRGGSVLDIAHGAGETLALHLSENPPPAHLHALTSLPFETVRAQDLVTSRFPDLNTTTTTIHWYTMSASYRPSKDVNHPLNPMMGYLGEGKKKSYSEDQDDDEEEEDKDGVIDFSNGEQTPFISGDGDESVLKRGYDLVYVLDAVYHFPPSISYFLTTVIQTLKEGTGIIAYTDILPPPNLSPVLGHLIIPPLLSIPARNLIQRPKDLIEYQNLLESIGYSDVKIEDWSEDVWIGFSNFLDSRGGMGWKLIGKIVRWMDRNGWKFIGVRARRPDRATE